MGVANDAAQVLARLRAKLFTPTPATPEAETAALLLYLGLPATAVLGHVSADKGGWVVWTWGPYPSKRALIPSSAATRLRELAAILKERHASEGALLRSLQYQMQRARERSGGLWWRDVRMIWEAYLGRGTLAKYMRLRQLVLSI